MNVIWTKIALITYTEILDFLKVRWTKKELKAFKDTTNETLSLIKTERLSSRSPIKN